MENVDATPDKGNGKRNYSRLPLEALTEIKLPDTEAVHRLYEEELKDFHRKVIVLDDDPTGVQTVSDVSVYTDWTRETFDQGLMEQENLFFILTNSRAFTPEETWREHMAIAEKAADAARDVNAEILLVSRGDSTLRGHYPLELEALKSVLEDKTGRRVDGQILYPFFQEGGRFTIDSVHYVREGEFLVPAGDTEFARDKTFGYHSSHLGEYIEEKSCGKYPRQNTVAITLSMLRETRWEEITKLLMEAHDFQPVVVDAAAQCDVEVFAVCLLRALKAGKEFLIRCAAALPKVLGNIPSRPLLSRDELVENTEYGGIVIVGSHVTKTTMQLEELRQSCAPVEFLEFRVNTCFREDGLEEETQRLVKAASAVMESGRTAVVYTSRQLLAPGEMSKEQILALSVRISDAVTAVITGLERKPRFLVAKGGITSSDVGTKALAVKKARVLGQVLPGIPVWKTGPESKFPGLSYIIFPGNVGDTKALRTVVELLSS